MLQGLISPVSSRSSLASERFAQISSIKCFQVFTGVFVYVCTCLCVCVWFSSPKHADLTEGNAQNLGEILFIFLEGMLYKIISLPA